MKLSYKLKKLLEPCKYFGDAQKKAMKPVLEYVGALESSVRHLEEQIRLMRQQDMFEPAEDKYGGRSTTLAVDHEPTDYSVEKHCKVILDTFGLDSEKVQSFMKRKGIDVEEFVRLAKQG